MHDFPVDSQTCTRVSGKAGNEAKDSGLTVQANWQKGGVAVGEAYNKKAHNFLVNLCNMAKLCKTTHTQFHWS